MIRRTELWKTGMAALAVLGMTVGNMGGGFVLAAENAETERTEVLEESEAEEATQIELSDDQILVNGEAISSDAEAAVYVGAEIVYYKDGQDATYGAGDEDDAHSEEEAAEHTVITITEPGTYRITGSISKGQIAVDFGEDADTDENAKVNLILDNADITCTVASAIVVYHAYECGSDDTESASKDVDTSEAGFTLILADGSENTVNGSHVAKIYKEGTTQTEIDAGEAKKAYKFDAAIDSKVSFNINAETEGTGKLTVNADNEGIESALHLTINGGTIEIHSADDAVNASEDGVSVLTINGGRITCDSGLGDEGDGMDSNGWIVINNGTVIAAANGTSQDSGVDSDLGIYLNGGTVLASGNMYDEIAADSDQTYLVLSFSEKVNAEEVLLLMDGDETPTVAFSAANSYQTLVYSSDALEEGDYTLYKVSSVTGEQNGSIYTDITDYSDPVQLQYSSTSIMGFPGGGFPGQMGEMPELPEGVQAGEMPELPEGVQVGKMPEPPEGAQAGERPELPEGAQASERPEIPEGAQPGEKPELPEGMTEDGQQENADSADAQSDQPDDSEQQDHQPNGVPQNGNGQESQEPQTVFTITGGGNTFSQISRA